MSEPLKKTLQIENLEIKISSDSSIPHVILNGVDFQAEDIGLQGINIVSTYPTKLICPLRFLFQVWYLLMAPNYPNSRKLFPRPCASANHSEGSGSSP